MAAPRAPRPPDKRAAALWFGMEGEVATNGGCGGWTPPPLRPRVTAAAVATAAARGSKPPPALRAQEAWFYCCYCFGRELCVV